MRYARRIDTNQVEIVEFLRKIGLKVYVGHDDILVSDGTKLKWYEIKSHGGRVTEGQKLLEREMPGCYKVVRNAQEIYNDWRYDQTTIPPKTPAD